MDRVAWKKWLVDWLIDLRRLSKTHKTVHVIGQINATFATVHLQSTRQRKTNRLRSVNSCQSSWSRTGTETMKHSRHVADCPCMRTVAVRDGLQAIPAVVMVTERRLTDKATPWKTSPEISRLGRCPIFANWSRQNQWRQPVNASLIRCVWS